MSFLSRSATPLKAAAVGSARSFSSTPAPQATLRELETRIRSVGNIGQPARPPPLSRRGKTDPRC